MWVCVSGGGEVVDGENGEQSHRETGCQKHRKLKKPKKKRKEGAATCNACELSHIIANATKAQDAIPPQKR